MIDRNSHLLNGQFWLFLDIFGYFWEASDMVDLTLGLKTKKCPTKMPKIS
jgi:hypothetical protein